MDKNCKQCGRKFSKPHGYSQKQWTVALYCTRRCMGLAWRGKTFSEQARRNMSLAHKRVPDEVLAERKRVRRIVRGAVRDGELKKQPCWYEPLGCKGQLEAHHHDYAKPLEVKWLCRRHHLQVHHGTIS